MRRAIVTIDAVHDAFRSSHRAFLVGRDELRRRAIVIGLAHPGNRLVGRVGGDVLDVRHVRAVDAAQVRKGIAPANMNQGQRMSDGVLFVIAISRRHD